MSPAPQTEKNFLERASQTLGVFRDVGLLSPRFLGAMLRGGLEAGASPALTVVAGQKLRGDEPAVIDDHGTTSFAELRDRTLSIAQGMRAHGVGPDHNVAILCRNHRGFLEAMMAASSIGADSLFLNTGFAAPQLSDVLEREGAGSIVYDEEFSDIVERSGTKANRFLAWSDSGSSAPTLADFARDHAPDLPPRPPRMGKSTILTSGTTGTPKGANRQTSAGSLETVVGLFERLPYRVGATAMICAPTFHAWGLINTMMTHLLSNTIVMHRRFDPERVLDAIARYRIDTLAVVPVMLQRILALGPEVIGRYDTSSLRFVPVSGSALPGELALRWMDTFGENLHNLYGSTEVSATSIATPSELRAAPGTAGKPPLGTVVRIYDENDRPVPDGTTGRIFVGNATQFEGYTGGGTKAQVDGLMSIGDLGHFDDNGLLFVEGRDDDMIISGGENVFPSEVEDLLSDHPAVLEAAVIGVPDDEFGQRLKAFVVLREGASFDVAAIKEHVRESLARHKVPREVVYLDEIPRNPTGKVLKRELREMD